MAYENLPGISATLQDGGLNVTRSRDYGDSILVIGTAENGPKNQPVPVTSLVQLENIFGRFGRGDLTRGVYEVWNATTSPVDCRAMRIGNGTRATLGIKEASGLITYEFAASPNNAYGAKASGLADPTFAASGIVDQFIDALTLTAKYEGSRYNSLTVRDIFNQDSTSAKFGRSCIMIYNQYTESEEAFSYDWRNPNNTSVDVHNVNELVDAINANSNLNPYISAATTQLNAFFEVKAGGGKNLTWAGPVSGKGSYIIPASGIGDGAADYNVNDIPTALKEANAISSEWNVDESVKKTIIRLHHITTSVDNDGNGIPDALRVPDPDYGVPTMIKVGPIGAGYTAGIRTDASNIATAGNQIIDLLQIYEVALSSGEILDVAGKDNAVLSYYPINRNGSQSYDTITGNTIVGYDGASTSTSQYKQYVKGGYIGTSSDGTTSKFEFVARLQPDIGTSATLPDRRNTTRYLYPLLIGSYVDEDDFAYLSGVERQFAMDHRRLVSTGTTELLTKIYETIGGVTSESKKPCTLTWAAGNGTIQFTDTTQLPVAGTILTIDYVSDTGTLTEYNTRSALEAIRSNASSPGATAGANPNEGYFVTGNNIYFGGPHDTTIKLSYNYKRDYDIPGDVSISSHDTGTIEFTNPSKQPQLTRVGGTKIGLNYTYRPEWVSVSGIKALSGGKDGTNMTNKEKKDALTSAYSVLEDYNVDIIVPMSTNLDDTINEFSPETGVKIEMNAGFHTQLAALLNTMQDNVNETIGIIGVKPATSNSLSDVKTWVEKLTIPNANDKLRAANYIPVFDSRWISVVAAEPGISANRLGVSVGDYYSNGGPLYAGLIASLASQKATTSKYIGRSMIGMRYQLSSKQLNDLVGMRYVAFTNKPSVGPVVVKDVTAAKVGSDYDRLTTVRIVKLVMKVVRQVCDPYIGNVNSAPKRNAMHTAINNALHKMCQPPEEALRDYDFGITATSEDQRLGIVRIDMALVPVFSIDKIYVTVKLRLDL